MAVPRSKISWTDFSGGDANFVIGCDPISEGCDHCFARAWAKRWGRDFSVKVYRDKLDRLAHWKPSPPERGHYKRGPGSRPMCFLVDMGDLFHPEVSDDVILQVQLMTEVCTDVDWQILTKQHKRLDEFSHYAWPENAWIGVTVESQRYVLCRMNSLQHVLYPKVKFVSVEPMLGPVDLSVWLSDPTLNWVVCGGESGPNRRPFDKAWARGLRDQCREAGVPFFFKQGSALRPGEDDRLDGLEVKEWPLRGGQ